MAAAVAPLPEVPPPVPAAATSWAPTAKVSAGVLAGAGTTLIVGLIKPHLPNFASDPGIVGAITSILTFVVQYLVPERKQLD
jgi:hypothetical protein